MPTITVQLETPIHRSFRVEQVAGMFDVPVEQRMRHELTAEVPGMDEEWTIGAIVGPSGSGKTTLARAAFGKAMYRRRAWPKDRAIIDCFAEVPVKLLAGSLVSVGLGSPPTWLKPYRVLSTGERFRADLLRALVYSRERMPVVFDEFSGALDRTIAKTTSAALARILRLQENDPNRIRFVAVTCHRDILPWLSPDWTVEVERGAAGRKASGTLVRGRPEKASFRVSVERVPQAMWTRFSGEHYLAGGLAASASCYAALWNQEPIGFCAVAASLGWKATKRIQRLVVLPEFQGIGVGGKLLDEVAAMEASKGNRLSITASHPAVLAHCSKSARWRLIGLKKNGSTRQRFAGREVGSSVGRAVVAFEWVTEVRSTKD